MKYPCLVPKRLCKTPVIVRLESEGINNMGEPEHVLVLELMCNFQDKAKRILTPEKKIIEVTGTALFPGDIVAEGVLFPGGVTPGNDLFPEVTMQEFPTLSCGTITVFGEERRIYRGTKARNPDGTVNYCQLEVI